jgi:hypothetical protein
MLTTSPPADMPIAKIAGRHTLLLALVALTSLALTACGPPASTGPAPILLYSGTGTSPNDVKAVEAILKEKGLDYALMNSAQLNDTAESQLLASRLIIIPGGNYLKMGDGLTSATLANIHNAVERGVNYLGICGGALLAGHAPYHSLNLTSGVRFDFYAVVNEGIHKAAVPITSAGSPPLDEYWEDGPQLTGWGDVVAKYPDGTPAVAEGTSGKGWVILCGVHPEAPENWRSGMTFNTPASADHAYAGMLIDAALHGTPLPHF